MSVHKTISGCLLHQFFLAPESVKRFDVRGWEKFIAQARSERLLAKCFNVLNENELLSFVPSAARNHLQSAAKITLRHEQTVRWEVDRVLYAIRNVGQDIILLKGAAYLFSEKHCSHGRIYTDIDILVRKGCLAEIEKKLMIHGWTQEKVSDYDQQYYRKWTHELPPLRHRRRGTLLDVHHSIAPNIFRYHISYDDFYESSQSKGNGIRVLADEDMLIHAIIHLVNEEEFLTAYRDLHDIASLINEFSAISGFWEKLLKRSSELCFEVPLYYGLTIAKQHKLAVVDDAFYAELKNMLGALSWPIRMFVAAMLVEVTKPKNDACRNKWFSFPAAWLLYIRGHYLRMPLYLLVPHLIRKFFTKKEE